MKKLLSIILTFALMLTVLPLGVFTIPTAASEEEYIKVYTVADLYNIRNDLTAKYILMNDIDLTEATAVGGTYDFMGNGWNPIGSNNDYDGLAFSGEFDGNGKKIIGMRIEGINIPYNSHNEYVGLFANVTGSVHDLILENTNITWSLSNYGYFGGVAGVNSESGSIYDVIVETTITISNGTNKIVGGIAGISYGTVSRCSTSGSISYTYAYKSGYIHNTRVGGIVGSLNGGTIEECYNTASVMLINTSDGADGYVGGICGEQVYSPNITNTTPSTINNCYNTGDIISNSFYTGGILGEATYSHTITNCYNIGKGLTPSGDVNSNIFSIAFIQYSSSKINECYYLNGIGKANTGATPLTDLNMKTQSSYNGFDFDTVWTMGGDPEYPYAELQCFALSGTLGISGNCVYSSTVAPDLSGINKVDETFTYEWFVGGVSVGTGKTYTIKAVDVGKKLKVKVVGTKEYNKGTIYSAEITVGKATQTAKPTVPEVLSLDDKSFQITTVSTQEYSIDNVNWQKSGLFTNLDPNKEYTVYSRVSENDLYIFGESKAVLTITTDRRALNGSVAIKGTTRYGDTLTADVSKVGPINVTYSYEWKRNGVVVGTGSTYALDKSDIGTNITLSVKGNGDFIGTLTSAAVEVTKTTVQLPNAPVVSEKTNTSVTLVSKTGYEYSKDKVTWQSSPVFTGLSAAIEYTFYQRVKETDTTFASIASSGTKVTTLKNNVSAPLAPEVVDVTNTTVTLKKIEGYQYSKDGLTWQNSNVFTGLNPFTEYAFCQRIAENEVDYASPQSSYTRVITLKNTIKAPSAPTISSATETTVTLKAISGYQYSLDGKTWQNSNIFRNLETLKTYNFYQRIAETEYDYVSPSSAAVSFKLKYIAAQTAKPVLKEATNNKIVIETSVGTEYSINGTTWQSGGTFSNLKPNTKYSVYARTPENDTHYAGAVSVALSVTTLKNTVEKPVAPKSQTITHNSITLVAINGGEYSKDGTTWQTSNVFTGLLPNKSYTFYQRVAETNESYVSAVSASATFKTLKQTLSAPSTPVISSKTATSVTLVKNSGYEYSKNGTTWQTSNVFSNLSPNTAYNFYQRIAETDTSYASAKSEALNVTTPKKTVSTPSKPIAEKVTQTTVTLVAHTGYEYSMDGETWQNSNMFSGLTANTSYVFYQRIAETDDAFSSSKSEGLSVTTLPKAECPITPAKPVVKDYTTELITLYPLEGYEYSYNGTTWSNSYLFLCSPSRTYTIYQRIAETDTHKASAASSVQVTTPKSGVSTFTYYDKLVNYINTNGTTSSDGYKTWSFKQTSGTYTFSFNMQYKNSAIDISFLSTSTSSSYLRDSLEFTLYDSSANITVDFIEKYYYQGSVVDTVRNSKTINTSTYSTNTTYTIWGSGKYITADGFQKQFNAGLSLLCAALDSNIYSKLGFGLEQLGFINYAGKGYAVCTPNAGYHTGTTEKRNVREASCLVPGYTGDTYCTKCQIKISSGTTIEAYGEHAYSDDCDTSCHRCGETRTIEHTYTDKCDEKCNVCGATREVEHNFNSDGVCADCGKSKCTPGDVTGDDKINSLDGLMLLRYLNGWNINIASPEAMDVNGDGKVNSLDGLMLMRYLNGWNITLG